MRKAVLSKPQAAKLKENLANLVRSLTPSVVANLYNEFVLNTTQDSHMIASCSFGNCPLGLAKSGLILSLKVTEEGESSHGEFEGKEITDVKEYAAIFFETYALEWFYFVVNYRMKAKLSTELAWDKIVQPIMRDKIIYHDRSKLNKDESTPGLNQEGGQANGSSGSE